jgi:hypothetical protein
MKIYSSRQRLHTHVCKNTEVDEIDDGGILSNTLFGKIPIKFLNDRPIIIINETNNNSKNNKNELNENSKNDNSNKVENKILNNFMDSKPKNYKFDYIIKDSLKNEMMKYINMDGYNEEEADQFMYEEDKFKELDEDIKRKYEKEPLRVEGMKDFFNELQKEPDNRNVVIKKSKSGKCHIYDTSWNEKNLKEITNYVCRKLCDTLYDKDTSLNHFIREVLGSQPGRSRLLRKYIQEEIGNIGKIIKEEGLGIIKET